MSKVLRFSLGLLGVLFQVYSRHLHISASSIPKDSGDEALGVQPAKETRPEVVEEYRGNVGNFDETKDESLQAAQEFSVCLTTPSIGHELRRICMMTVDHLPALYRRLTVQYEITQELSPLEVLSAVSDGLHNILAEEEHINQLVLKKRLPKGALPVHSLKLAIENKLQTLNRLKPKNITNKPGLMGLELKDGKLQNVAECVEAQVTFFHDLMGPKFKLSKMTHAEVASLVDKIMETFSDVVLKESDLSSALQLIAREAMDEVAALPRAESLGAALQSMPPFTPVGDDDGLNPLSPSGCLTLVRGLFPSLRAHMTLQYEVEDPTEAQLQAMADVLLPMVNAHRSRVSLSTRKGVTLLAPEEHALIWAYMEQFAKEHNIVGRERPLNLWRFPNPSGAANLLD